MTSKAQQPFHIAIIGGGIGGAVLGVALAKYPHITFTIYESHGAFGEIGAGLAFGANSHLAMQLIEPELWKAYQTKITANSWPEKEDVWFEFLVGEKGENEGQTIAEIKVEGQMPLSTIMRSHFLDELARLLPENCTVFNKRLVDVEQTEGKVVCKFADGTTATADAVIGCDGIKSGCRPIVYGKDSKLSKPVFTQKVAYRGVIPRKVAEQAIGAEAANNRKMHLGHGGHVLTFPVAKGSLLTVVAFHSSQSDVWEGSWIQPLQKESLQRDFVGWGEKVTKLLNLIQPDVWAIFEHPPVSTFHKGRLCLLGDAAHATSPHYGQGAGMAIEDAYVLSTLLGLCNSSADITVAFQGYDAVRVPRALKVTQLSNTQGKNLDFEGGGIGDDLGKLAEELDTTVKWIWNVDLEAHLAEAVQIFESVRSKAEAIWPTDSEISLVEVTTAFEGVRAS